MPHRIRILIAEDNPADAEMTLLQLRASGFEPEWTRVETEADFIKGLESHPDLVLSDFQMPQFNGLRALELVKQSGLDVPFILLSGTIGEETAVVAMKNGASDYLMKDRLVRLGAAVTHALAERKQRGERRLADEKGQRLSAELRVLFDMMPAMIWFKDTENRILRANQMAAEKTRMPVSEIEGKETADVYPLLSARFFSDDLKVIQSGTPKLGVVESVFDRDGKDVWVQTDRVPVKDKDGKVVGIVVMAQDITQRKRAEEALRDSEERFSEAFEHAPIGVALLSIEGIWLKVNRALCTLLGYSEAELLAADIEDITHPHDRAMSRENLRRIGAGEINSYTVEKRYIHRLGNTVTVLLSVSIVRERLRHSGYLIAQIQDITSRRNAEIELEELSFKTARRERILNTALSSMTDFAQIYDREGRLLFVNEPLLKLWGRTLEDVVGKNFTDLKYPAELACKLERQLQDVFETRESVIDETPYTSPTGLTGVYEYIFSPVFAADGRVDMVVGSTRDVTERKRSEASLRAGEANLAAAQRIAHLGSWEMDLTSLSDLNANALRWSDEMFRIAGLEPRAVEVTVPMFFSMIPADEHDPIRKAVTTAIREKGPYAIIHRLTRADGEVRVIKEMAQIFLDPKTELPVKIVGTAHDITEQKRLEEQIRQSQKMDAIGTLAGGIAHDFNNILTAINGYTELSQIKLEGNPDVQGYLAKVRQAASRAADLVRQILTFSRQQPLERRPIQLFPLVAETFNLLRATIPSSIEFDLSLATDAPPVLADATQIHQILMNLGTNAWHAMKNGTGRLRVTLEKCWVDGALAEKTQSLQPGLYTRISVADTGCGMDKMTLRRIFEPFFTTKVPGEGTGLGLAVVHGIVDNHDGAITVDSCLGEGTVFNVYLPAYGGESTENNAALESVQRGHGQRVLVVDDEELLAQLGQQMLSELGYEAEFTTLPSAAISMVRADPERFALVITDQTMPGMTGLLLAIQLRLIRPDLPIVLMTGYSASVNTEGVKGSGIRQVLLKPASIQTLGKAVHEALAQGADSDQFEVVSSTSPSAPCYIDR